MLQNVNTIINVTEDLYQEPVLLKIGIVILHTHEKSIRFFQSSFWTFPVISLQKSIDI